MRHPPLSPLVSSKCARPRFVATLSAGVLALSAFVGACGGSSESESAGSGSGPVTLEQLPAEVAKVQCGLLARCYGALATTVLGTDCEARLQRSYEDGAYTELKTAVAAGKATYNPELVSGCLKAIETAACEDLLDRMRPECEAAGAGTIADGSACDSDAECAGVASFCKVDAACPGTCTPLLGAGESCKSDGECANGLECSEQTRRCAAPSKAGADCGGGVAPDCAPGLFCLGEDDSKKQAGTCKTLSETFSAKLGAECSFNGPFCETGAVCAFTGGAQGKCTTVVASGGSCSLSLPGQCPAGEYCPLTLAEYLGGQTSATCAALPKAGSRCAQGPLFGINCEAGSACGADGICRSVQRPGGPCDSNAVCASGLCKDGGCVADTACNR